MVRKAFWKRRRHNESITRLVNIFLRFECVVVPVHPRRSFRKSPLEAKEEISRLDEAKREAFPLPGEATAPRPDAGELGPKWRMFTTGATLHSQTVERQALPASRRPTGSVPTESEEGYRSTGGSGGYGFDFRVDTLRVIDSVTSAHRETKMADSRIKCNALGYSAISTAKASSRAIHPNVMRGRPLIKRAMSLSWV